MSVSASMRYGHGAASEHASLMARAKKRSLRSDSTVTSPTAPRSTHSPVSVVSAALLPTAPPGNGETLLSSPSANRSATSRTCSSRRSPRARYSLMAAPVCRPCPPRRVRGMPELLVDFITSLDGYAAADGWPGWWGLEGPEYLAWLGEQPEAAYTVLMGATTYRLMSGFAAEGEPGTDVL